MNRIIFLVSLLSIPSTFYSQINTDGPSETEAPHVVPACFFQAESDFILEDAGQNHSYRYPQTLLRYGILQHLEIRAEVGLLKENHDKPGIQPVRAGAKYHLFKGKRILPEISALVMVEIPWMADKRFQENAYEPEWRLLMNNEITSALELEYNVGMLWQQSNRKPEYTYTICCNLELSDKWKAYLEEYAFLPSHRHIAHTVDIGVLFLLTPNFQLDFSAGQAVSNDHLYFARAGFAFRV